MLFSKHFLPLIKFTRLMCGFNITSQKNFPIYEYFKGDSNTNSVNVTLNKDRSSEQISVSYMYGLCHPEIVGHVWDRLGKDELHGCHCIINGCPALVCPKSGVLLAVCLGTSYMLRIIEADTHDALDSGSKQVHDHDWSGPKNLAEEFGVEWYFGSFANNEYDWLLTGF